MKALQNKLHPLFKIHPHGTREVIKEQISKQIYWAADELLWERVNVLTRWQLVAQLRRMATK